MGQQRRKETVASPPPPQARAGRVGSGQLGKAAESPASKKRSGATTAVSAAMMVQLPVASVAPSSLAPPWQRCRDNAALVAEQLMPIMETARTALMAIQATAAPTAALAKVVSTQLAVCTEFIERPNLDRRVTTNKLAATTLLQGVQTLLLSTAGTATLTDRVRKQLTQVCTDLVPFEMTDRDRKHACAAIKRRKGAPSASSSSASAAATHGRSRRAAASAASTTAAAAHVPTRRAAAAAAAVAAAVVPASPVAAPASPIALNSVLSSTADVADKDDEENDDDNEEDEDDEEDNDASDDEDQDDDVKQHESAAMAGLHDSGNESYDDDFDDADSFIATDPAASDSDSDDEFSSTDAFRGSTEDLRTFFEMGSTLTMMSDSMTEDHAYSFTAGRSSIARDPFMDAYAPALSRQNSNASSFAASVFVRQAGGRYDSPLRLPSLSESNPFLLSLSATPDDHMSL